MGRVELPQETRLKSFKYNNLMEHGLSALLCQVMSSDVKCYQVMSIDSNCKPITSEAQSKHWGLVKSWIMTCETWHKVVDSHPYFFQD